MFLAGDEEYRSEEALPMLAKILSQRHGFKCTVLFSVDPDGTINPKNGRSLSNPAALDTADAIVMSLRFRAWPDDDMARFDKLLRAGKPIVALRTSTHAFNGFPKGSAWETWNYNNQGGFGKRVLGETWVTHWGRHKVEATRGAIEPQERGNPLLRGITGLFGDTDVYEAYPPSDATILVRGIVLQTLAPDSAPADYRKARATDKQQQGINDPADARGLDAPQQERQRHDEQDPDDDDGFSDGFGERRSAPARRERRVLGTRHGRARQGGRDLRRRIPPVVLRVRRLSQRAARLGLRAREESAGAAAAETDAGCGPRRPALSLSKGDAAARY